MLSSSLFCTGRRILHCKTRRSTMTTSSMKTFHRRKLPDNLISLSSREGRKLFQEALEKDTMESYFPLSEQFITQSEPSYCSLSSLAMVLNALNHDPKRTWKGVWRWVTEETLQCENLNLLCEHSLEKIRQEGMDFRDFEQLGKCHNVIINSFQSPHISNIETDSEISEQYEIGLEEFREVVKSSCELERVKEVGHGIANEPAPDFFVISNFSREFLGQTGDGHFSPVGGYHGGTDSVLILDVARFKYPPYWVPLKKLWDAMCVVDKATGNPRGYFVVKSSQ